MTVRWNWAAFFATFAWLRYRRLYAWSWAYFFVSTPVLLAVALLPTIAGDACERALAPAPIIPTAAVVALLAVLGFIVPPLFAHRFRRDPALAPSKLGVAVAVVLHLVVIGVIFGSAGYGNYLYRSRVDSGVQFLMSIKTPLAEYYLDKGRFPATLAELGIESRDEFLERMDLAPDGTVHALFRSKWGRLAGHSVELVPEREDDSIGWQCRSEDLPDVCLPSACRAGR